MSFKIGIDVGGTFTDLFLWSDDRAAQTFKVLSTPRDPSVGVLAGLEAIAASRGITPRELAGRTSLVVHGTTVTTNASLTRGGAKTGLVTTEGVRDALEMRRGIRERQYDNRYTNVVPLVPRYLRRPVAGRLDFRGEEVAPLALDDVREAAARFRDEGIEAVAVCLMHSYASDAHEQAVASVLREELPDAWLSVSSEVMPTIRFYERVSTTVLNAYVGPVLREYLGSLTHRLSDVGFDGVLLIMQSNGGVAVPDLVQARPATTLLSGPAAGPRAAATYAAALGWEDCILMDMGGTSFDASLVRDGAASLSSDGEIDRLRIALPMLEIATIGAGGGSVGWIDAGGLLQMGPESAGALPGPACYDRGGRKPACTDADLVLGFLDAGLFAGGDMPLAPDLAEAAIREHVAEPLGVSVEEAAAGMYAVINANMAHGVREITVKRGLDPREFPMVVAGGAGALHACAIAAELQIPTLIVPPTASTLCATGMLLSDLQHDFVRSCVGPLDEQLRDGRLGRLVRELSAEGARQLEAEGAASIEHQVSLDLRYLKQYHEVTVRVPGEAVEQGDIAAIGAEFHGAHDRLYGYSLEEAGTGLELINLRVRSVGHTERPDLPMLPVGDADPSAALRGERRAWVPERARFEVIPVYDGHALCAGNQLAGPALIERVDTTIFVSAGFDASVDPLGSVVLQARQGEQS